jgi:citrate lyase subunit beta/citryl-CoA lyase
MSSSEIIDTSTRLRRSLLFVPGSAPARFDRAREAGADTVLFDLEDAVAPEEKARAREHVAAALRAGGFGETEAAVRVNAPSTPHFVADLEAVVAAGARTVMLPKTEGGEDLRTVADTLAALERRLGIVAERGVRLLALVETATGLANAIALAQASPRVDALCFGHVDFALDMQLDDPDASVGVIHHARCALAIAARAGRVVPIDTVCVAVRDEEAFRADVVLGMRLGFEGKLCIHPRQVMIANEVYTPAAARIERALRVVEAWRQAEAQGRGVFALDGMMVDAPVVAAQRRVLERARRAGVLVEPSGGTDA